MGRHRSTTGATSQETCQTGTLVGSRGMTTTADQHFRVFFCDGGKKFTVAGLFPRQLLDIAWDCRT